jgi:hypothetical protein
VHTLTACDDHQRQEAGDGKGGISRHRLSLLTIKIDKNSLYNHATSTGLEK